MSEHPDTLFDEFVAGYQRGERPDPRTFLARAGANAPALVERIDRYLTTTAPPAPSPQAVAMMQAWIDGRSPLLALRTDAGATRDHVVEAIVADLAIAEDKRDRVARRYHDLETGLLRLGGVDRRVLAAIARAVGARISDLLLLRHTPAQPAAQPAAAGAFYRSAAPAVEVAETLHAAAQREEAAPDEVDRLFGVEP